MVFGADILEISAKKANKHKAITVEKHLDLVYDLGNLLAVDNSDFDTTKLSENKETYFLDLARDNTQLLLLQLWKLQKESVEEGVVVRLPPPTTKLPRMKPVTKPKHLTKWQLFAKNKGIRKKKLKTLGHHLQKRVPMHCYLEVAKNAKSKNVSRNELRRLRPIARARKIEVDVNNSETISAKNLQNAITEASSSKVPEKPAIGTIIPSRKRKMSQESDVAEKEERPCLNKRMRK